MSGVTEWINIWRDFCLEKLGNRASPGTVPPIAMLKIHFCLNVEIRIYVFYSIFFCPNIQLAFLLLKCIILKL